MYIWNNSNDNVARHDSYVAWYTTIAIRNPTDRSKSLALYMKNRIHFQALLQARNYRKCCKTIQ